MRYFLLTILLLNCAAIVNAENRGIVRGKITDMTTGEPLAGVYVIYGRHLGTTSGDDGSYSVVTDPGKKIGRAHV